MRNAIVLSSGTPSLRLRLQAPALTTGDAHAPGVADERDLRAAQSRVAQKAVEDMNERRARRRAERRRRRRTDEA